MSTVSALKMSTLSKHFSPHMLGYYIHIMHVQVYGISKSSRFGARDKIGKHLHPILCMKIQAHVTQKQITPQNIPY